MNDAFCSFLYQTLLLIFIFINTSNLGLTISLEVLSHSFDCINLYLSTAIESLGNLVNKCKKVIAIQSCLNECLYFLLLWRSILLRQHLSEIYCKVFLLVHNSLFKKDSHNPMNEG